MVNMIIFTVLAVTFLFFAIVYFFPKRVAENKIKIFADFTDITSSFVLALMIIPFFCFALITDIPRFIKGYSFLMVLFVAYNLHFAFYYNKKQPLKIVASFFVRFIMTGVNAIFWGINLLVLKIYTENLEGGLTILWGATFLFIAFFISVVSMHNLASVRRFSPLTGFVKNIFKIMK